MDSLAKQAKIQNYIRLKGISRHEKSRLDQKNIVAKIENGALIKDLVKELQPKRCRCPSPIDCVTQFTVNEILKENISEEDRKEIGHRNHVEGGKRGYSRGIAKLIKENPDYLHKNALENRWDEDHREQKAIKGLLYSNKDPAIATYFYITKDGENPTPIQDIMFIMNVKTDVSVYRALDRAEKFGLLTREERDKEKQLRASYFRKRKNRDFLEKKILTLVKDEEMYHKEGSHRNELNPILVQNALKEENIELSITQIRWFFRKIKQKSSKAISQS